MVERNVNADYDRLKAMFDDWSAAGLPLLHGRSLAGHRRPERRPAVDYLANRRERGRDVMRPVHSGASGTLKPSVKILK